MISLFSDVDSLRVEYELFENGEWIHRGGNGYAFYERDVLGSFSYIDSINIRLRNGPTRLLQSNCTEGVAILDE